MLPLRSLNFIYMKKVLKYIAYVFLGFVALLVIAALLIRFVFRDEAADFAKEMLGQEYTETLQSAQPYHSDTTSYSLELIAPLDKSREIRDYFRLDSLTQGSGSTWEKVLRIARIAASVKHDNPNPSPTKYNAIDLWKWAERHPSGFNCRTHSIMLHEMLLSVGIANRVITCSPKDTTDRDCHVVNSVWLPESKKWVMIDSDKHAYAMGEDGNLLSLKEMRVKVIKGESIVFESFLEEPIKERNLRYYWAKNLYYFDALEKQTFDVETRSDRIYRKIYLVPELSGYPKSYRPQYDVLTTDVDRFWKEPTPPFPSEE